MYSTISSDRILVGQTFIARKNYSDDVLVLKVKNTTRLSVSFTIIDVNEDIRVFYKSFDSKFAFFRRFPFQGVHG